MIEILRIIGGKETVVCTVPDDNASVVSEIMGREEVNASVTVDGPLGIRVGDYVRVDGTAYTLNREAGMEKRSDVEYRYDLVFESPLYRLLDKLFTHPVTGVSTFTVSRTLKEFVKIVVDCINTIDPGWTVSAGIPDTDPVNLTFEGISCREALTRLSDGFGMEFYLSGREIRFVRDMENATGLVFEQGKGKGLYTVTQEPVDTGDVVTRVYPYGGMTNVFPADGDVNGRLYLPERYLEDLTGYGKVVEREVVFDDIFPCLKASAGSVSGEYNRVLTCEAIGFDINSYGIAGVKAKINLLSGDLMGESFEFTYTHAGKQINLIRKEDRMVDPDSEGKRPLIPHDLKKVRAGDRFNLTDIYVPEEYKEKAIGELRARATDYLAYYSRPRVKFTLEVDHRYLRGRRVLRAGDTVTVKIPETGMEKPLRVNSVERNLKTGKMSCVVSNYLDEKWEKRIEGELTSIKSSVSGDISDIRGEVSNVSRPSSLWYPDKLKEYFRLNEDNTITMLENPLHVKGNMYSDGDQIAFANTSDITEVFAIASPTNYGLVKIDGSTVKVNVSGQLYTDVAGLDETTLKKYLDDKSYITSGYLTTNKYITEDYITKGKYITLSSLLDGYVRPATYTAIAATDTLLSAFGKLDRRFDDYVDRTTAQTIGGIKTFTEDIRANKNIISDGDQIAFGNTTDITEVFAVAGTTNYGLVKIDGSTVRVNGDGQLYVDISGAGTVGGITVSGSGNAITGVTLSPDKRSISFDKATTFWHAGNDGSGSGLDADLLDGRHWSEIAGLNVASATKLLYARTINGTSFDGTANIVTNTWGTERPFSIADHDFTNEGVAIKVNGFSSYVLPLPSTIKATLLGNASSSTVATRLQTARTLWGQTFDGSGNVSGAMSGVTRINDMIHLDVAGAVGIGDKSGSWARFTGNRLDGMTVGGVMSDLYLNYTSPAKNARVDKDGNLITSGNVISDGDQIAFGSAGDITEVFAIASPTNYGLVKIDGSTIKIGADGRLYSEGSGGFGDIAFSGDGPFLSDVTPSADKRTLTFTRVGKPAYNASEVGAIAFNSRMNANAKPFREMGYGYNADGFPGSGPAFCFGADDLYNKQVWGPFERNSIFLRSVNNGVFTGWREFAFLDSNVASATNADMVDGYHSYSLMTMDYRGIGNIIANNTIYSGYGFGYSSDGWPTSGSYINFSGLNGMYPVQIQGAYHATELYFRTRNGDNGTWNPIHKIMTCQGDMLTSSSYLTLGAGISTISTSPSMGWDSWQNYNQPFRVREVAVTQGSYYPVIGWSSVMPNGWRQYASIGSLRDGGFGRVAITVGSSDNNSTSAKFFFHSNGLFESGSNITANGFLFSVSNGHTIQIGSQNSGYCHYQTTAPNHYFNKTVVVSGHVLPYENAITYLGGSDNRWRECLIEYWLRIYDSGGLYFQKWGGGISMEDSTYVKVYGRKCFAVESELYYSINNSGGYYRGTYQGNAWSNGRGALNIEIFNNGNQTPLIVAARGDGFESATGNRLFAMELLNSGSMMVFAFNAVQRFTFHSNGLLLTNDDQVAFSDMRLKNKIEDYDLDICDFVDTPLFTYTKKGSEKDGLRVGTSAQWMLDHMRLCVYGSERDYYSYSYSRGGFILGVSIIKRVVPWMDEKDKKIEELERRIHILESRQAS